MKLIRTVDNQFIKPDSNCYPRLIEGGTTIYWMFGYRFNKNEQKFSKHCVQHLFGVGWTWVDESELPKALTKIE